MRARNSIHTPAFPLAVFADGQIACEPEWYGELLARAVAMSGLPPQLLSQTQREAIQGRVDQSVIMSLHLAMQCWLN